jgi:hypothetical protein
MSAHLCFRIPDDLRPACSLSVVVGPHALRPAPADAS